MADTARYRFGPFLLEPALRRLMRDSSEIAVPPKAFDILVLLVRTRDRVLTKQELLDAVWPETAVTENTLTQRIREIREALDDDAQEPRYVRTVSRVGYRFVGEVTGEESASQPPSPLVGFGLRAAHSGGQVGEPGPATVAAEAAIAHVLEPAASLPSDPAPLPTMSADEAGIPSIAPARARWVVYAAAVTIVAFGGFAVWFGAIRPAAVDREQRVGSIAVLPLENLSRDTEQQYFADGMTDELIKELAGIRALRVISRTSAVRYKGSTKSLGEIGRELNVDAVVEGSVLRAGQQARITLRLIEVATDRTLLAESFARDMEDVLSLQSQIARAVAEQIRATVTPPEMAHQARRVIPEAYNDYLMGRASWNTRTPDGVKQALLSFQRAVERDPTFAAAWAGIADCYIVFSGALLGVPEREAYTKAREAATRALALDEALAEAHTSLGSVKSEYDWDWAGAEAEYTRAIAINANYVTARQWYGEFLFFRGRYEESLTQLERARQLDPLSAVVNNSLAIALLFARRYDRALVQAQRTLEIEPGFPGALLTLGEIYSQQGRHTDAITVLERAVSLSPGLTGAAAWLGHAYAVAGHDAKARQVLGQLEAASKRAPVSPYDVALIHAGLGDTERAFAWLEKAYHARAWDLIKLNVDRRFDNLHGDPRFADLVRRVAVQPRS